MTNSDAYERGKRDGLDNRRDTDPCLLANDSPEWSTVLVGYSKTRDEMYALAAQGNERALQQAEYLDGYLSVWD